MKQLTVLVPHRVGVVADITAALAEQEVNIEELDVEGLENHGILVLSVDKYDVALRVLHAMGYRVVTQDALLIRLEDKPGALAKVALRLKNTGLDLRSMHIIRREEGCALVSLVASDHAKAAAELKDVLAVEPPL